MKRRSTRPGGRSTDFFFYVFIFVRFWRRIERKIRLHHLLEQEDGSVQLECTFLHCHVDGDDGLPNPLDEGIGDSRTLKLAM